MDVLEAVDICEKVDEDNERMLLEDHGEMDDGHAPVEATVGELAEIDVSTAEGTPVNRAFHKVADAGFESRCVRGWYSDEVNEVSGELHIECDNSEADEIVDAFRRGGGSVRSVGSSDWAGFWEFMIE